MADVTIQFERGYLDATNERDQYFWLQFDVFGFCLTPDSDTPYNEDMPDLSGIDRNVHIFNLCDQLQQAFEAKGWRVIE